MTQLAFVRSVPVPFVYLTATLPPSLRDTLYERHYLTNVIEVRASTRRDNLGYSVVRLGGSGEDIFKGASSLLQARWQRRCLRQPWGPHRGLVFTRTKAAADRVAELLECESLGCRHDRFGSKDGGWLLWSSSFVVVDWKSGSARMAGLFAVILNHESLIEVC